MTATGPKRTSSNICALVLSKPKLTVFIPERKWIAIALVAVICGCGATKPETTDRKEIIIAGDPRFDVFELSNSAGDGTFASFEGTVYLSFSTGDSRYCRAARFHTESTAILACRNERGWEIEATSELAPGSRGGALNGGIVTPAVNDAIFTLNPKAEFLDEREVIEAASKGWY